MAEAVPRAGEPRPGGVRSGVCAGVLEGVQAVLVLPATGALVALVVQLSVLRVEGPSPVAPVVIVVTAAVGAAYTVVACVVAARGEAERRTGYTTQVASRIDLDDVAPCTEIVVRPRREPLLEPAERRARLAAAYARTGGRMPWPARVAGTVGPAFRLLSALPMVLLIASIVIAAATGVFDMPTP